jgi:hypothetical protein
MEGSSSGRSVRGKDSRRRFKSTENRSGGKVVSSIRGKSILGNIVSMRKCSVMFPEMWQSTYRGVAMPGGKGNGTVRDGMR